MSNLKIELSARVIHTGEQWVIALCERVDGHPKIHCLYGNHVDGLHQLSLSVRDHDRSPQAEYRGQPYPLDRICEHYKEIARHRGIDPDALTLAQRLVPGIRLPVPPEPPETAEAGVPRAASGPKLGGIPRTGGANLVKELCLEFNISPPHARKALRKAGMHAPYTDAAKIRAVLQQSIESEDQ